MGLIGPNGAGKTTLLRVMAGLQAPTAGRTRIMGHDVLERDAAVRRHIGFAPDDPPLYNDVSVQEFLTFIGRSYGLDAAATWERVDFWLEQLWLSERRHDKIGTLSRGMRQRVTVARTLIPNPNVVLLDEPSAGLDPAGRAQFREVLASLRDQGKALVVSSHILADLEEYCTHIAIIEQGAIVRMGRVAEMHDRPVGRRRYELRAAAARMDLGPLLSAIEGVDQVSHRDGRWTLEYHEGPERAAELLRGLIGGGVAVSSFSPVGETLEQVYLRSGVKQVD